MSKFQIILTAVFAIFIIFGVAIFALSKSSVGTEAASLTVWGTISPDAFNAAYKASSVSANKMIQVTYVQKDATTFDSDFVNALADGDGPDIVILRDDDVYANSARLFTIPYANYSQGTFDNNFIPEGDTFLTPSGAIALPFIVDPLVMYWNKDMFTNDLVAQTPQYWDQIPNLINTMTVRDSNADITKSAIALGEWDNISNAKEIISMLLMQAGTPIVSRDSTGMVTSVLNDQFNQPTTPSTSAINFYTEFANPTSPTYTWNKSLPTSQNFFLSGDLAMYLGFASELSSIQQKNANLNFDVTDVPQIRGTTKKVVFGHMYVLAIVKQSKQIAGSFTTVAALTEPAAITALDVVTNLPPVRRDLLGVRPTDPYQQVFYDSALLSNTWIDPSPTASATTFRDMIQSITSGTAMTTDALTTADTELDAELKGN